MEPGDYPLINSSYPESCGPLRWLSRGINVLGDTCPRRQLSWGILVLLGHLSRGTNVWGTNVRGTLVRGTNGPPYNTPNMALYILDIFVYSMQQKWDQETLGTKGQPSLGLGPILVLQWTLPWLKFVKISHHFLTFSNNSHFL